MLGTGWKVRTSSWVTFSFGLLHIDTLVLVDQQNLTFISSVWTLDPVYRTFQKWWSIGMDGKKESRESMLLVHHDEDSHNVSAIVPSCLLQVLIKTFWKFPSSIFYLINRNRYKLFPYTDELKLVSSSWLFLLLQYFGGCSLQTSSHISNHLEILNQTKPNHLEISNQTKPNHLDILNQTKPNHFEILNQTKLFWNLKPNQTILKFKTKPNHFEILNQTKPFRNFKPN